MRYRLFTLFLLCLLFPGASFAQSIAVRHLDGTSTFFPLPGLSKIEPKADKVSFTSSSGTILIPNEEVLTIRYVPRFGDVNRDFLVDVSDVVAVINVMSGDDNFKRFSDVNGDCYTDISDVVAIINEMAGKNRSDIIHGQSSGPVGPVGDLFCIFRNDGEFNMFLREEVKSITFDSGVQTVQTTTQSYTFSLDDIEYMSFVRKDPVYKAETIRLDGNIHDYVKNVDGMTITLDSNTPSSVLPKSGDKLAIVESSDKFPCGFAGWVSGISSTDNGWVVKCRPADLHEVMSQFYGYAILVEKDVDGNDVKARQSAQQNEITRFTIDIPEINKSYTSNMNVFIPYAFCGINGRSKQTFNAEPVVTGWMKCVVDSERLLSFTELHAVCRLHSSTSYTLSGRLEEPIAYSAFKSDQVRGPWGTRLYLDVGPRIWGDKMDLAMTATVNADYVHTVDITYYPTSMRYNQSNPCVNRVEQHTSVNGVDVDVENMVMKGSLKAGFDWCVGLPLGSSQTGCIAGSLSAGVETDASCLPDDDLRNAGSSTKAYESMQNAMATITPCWSVHGLATGTAGPSLWQLGDDYSESGTAVFDGSVIPAFSNVKLSRDKNNPFKYVASAKVSRGGLIPYQLGFEIFDENGDVVRTPVYYEKPFKNENDYSSYSVEFQNLSGGKKYRVYPVVKMAGFDVLASPYAELDVPLCPDNKHPHAIDLGIGVKFACCNVGASSPWEYGGYYAWGETKVKDKDGWENYSLCDSTVFSCKYIEDISGTDYDVAHVKWKGNWCMPSAEQLNMLVDNCTKEWTTVKGVNGWLFTGTNGNYVFFPAAGDHSSDTGRFLRYWSSTIGPSRKYSIIKYYMYAYGLYTNDDEPHIGYSQRIDGQSVRPVMK